MINLVERWFKTVEYDGLYFEELFHFLSENIPYKILLKTRYLWDSITAVFDKLALLKNLSSKENYISSECSAEGQVLHCRRRNLGLQFCRRQDFHCKFKNQGCSFIRDWIGATASRCFPHPTLSLASEQTLKDLKRSQGHQLEVRRVYLANRGLRTSLKFSTWVKYQFHHGFWPD